MKTEERKYLTVRGFAERYGLSKSTIDKLRLRGEGPSFHRIGSRVLYRITDIDLWMETRRHG